MRWPFRREQKSLSDPSAELLAILGAVPAAAGVSVSPGSALQVPAVVSAIRLLSESAASLPASVVRIEADGTEVVDRSHPVNRLLEVEANSWTSFPALVRDMVASANLYDAGGLCYVNRVDGRAVELIQYANGAIQVTSDASTGEPSYSINSRPVPAANIIHVRSGFGKCPTTLARESIAVALVLERFAAKFFAQGARPSGWLGTDKSPGDAGIQKILAAWKATQASSENAGRTPVLWDGLKYNQLQMTSTDAQFLELRKFTILEICRAYRVPPGMLYELDRATWSNGEQQGKEFLSYSLESWLIELEAALRRGLFLPDEREKYAIRFSRDDLSRVDLTARATAISSLISARVLNPNEGRDWLGMPPREGGSEFANPNTGNNQPGAPTPPTPAPKPDDAGATDAA